MIAPLQVDVTSVLLTGLRAQLPAARFVTELPGDLEQASVAGCCRVERAGGGDDGVLLDTATVVLNCFGLYDRGAATQDTSRAFAAAVVGAMYALKGQTYSGAAFSYIRKLSGPNPSSYENLAVRRQVLTFRVGVLAV